MPSAVSLQEHHSWEALRALARRSKNVNQWRRLLSLATVPDGRDCETGAKIGGTDRQTLRDRVHRFNALIRIGIDVDQLRQMQYRGARGRLYPRFLNPNLEITGRRKFAMVVVQ